MEIHAIVAVDINGAIGKSGKLPWHLPDELQHFKNTTMNHPMILGRTTFDSFKKPLPGRTHLVLTSKPLSNNEQVFAFKNKEQLLNHCENLKYNKVFICGGSSIYKLFIQEINFWHISHIQMNVADADTFLDPELYKKFDIKNEQQFVDQKTLIPWIYRLYQR